jgi:hypothetical protein
MKTWPAMLALAATLCVLTLPACGGSGTSQPVPVGPTVGPAVTLPPVWTPTSLPATPRPGWQAMTGAGVTVNLPASFIGGDPIERRGELLAIARAGGPSYEGVLITLETATHTLVFYAWDFTVHISTLGITRREVPADASPDEALTQWIQAIHNEFPEVDVVESGMASLRGVVVGRAVVDIPSGEAATRQLSYLVLEDGVLYIISYAGAPEAFSTLLPLFEESIQTVRILR